MKRHIKNIVSVMLAIIIAVSAVSLSAKAALTYGGSCGENLSWSFNEENGILNINGTGTMGDYALTNIPWHTIRSEIKTVNIFDGVTEICDYAFYNCSSLSDVNISSSVSSIGNLAFAQCYELVSVSVDKDNQYYFSDDCGALFNKTQTELIQYPSSASNEKYDIPDTVKKICEDAFRYAQSLKYVSLSSSLETIEKNAFYASSINNVTIPSTVTNIGKDAFGWCSSLTEIEVDEINNIYSSDEFGVLFSKDKTVLIKYPNCNTQTDYNIPDTVTIILDNSFENCYKLESVTIPSSVTEIGNGVFFNCFLNKITVDESNQNYSSDEYGVLFSKDKTELIQYPICNNKTGYNIPDGTETVKAYAFHNNKNIQSIMLPGSVKTIENGAFTLCDNLKYIHIGKNTASIAENIISGDTYICAENENCYAKEYANTNGIKFSICSGHSVAGITLSETEITLKNKSNYLLTATVTPDTASDKSVIWSSGNSNIVSVNESGVITALSAGMTTITATTNDGKYAATCQVTVEPRYFEIIWNIDGAESTHSVAEGSEIQIPSAPEKTGYTFAGWSPEIPDKMPENNLKFTAKWAVNSYNAVFNSNGGEWSDGSTEKSYSVKYGEKIYSPRTPSKLGYVFAGWSPEPDTMDDINGKKFDAVWEASTDTKYTVEFYIMETDGSYTKTVENLTGTTDTTITAKYTVEKGFLLNDEKSVLSGNIAADGSLVLKVYLDREKHVVTLNRESFECLYGAEIDEPEMPEAPEGHLQEGWIDKNGNTVTFPFIVNEKTPDEIHPNFVRQSYTVKWIIDDASTTDTYLFEAKINALADPVKTGYTFIGWSPAVEETMPSHNLEYTAVWIVNSYDAIFDANSGTWSDGTYSKTVKTNYNAQIIAPESPVKAGYIFAGWSPEIGIMDDISGKKFTAEWIPSSETIYTVEFYTMLPDGSYSKITQKLTGTTDSTVTADYTVETGFVLNETKSILSGVVSADNSLVLKTYIDRKAYTLTTVSDGISNSTTYLYGASVVEPATPAKDGYDFIGWDKEIPATMPDEDITLTAKFTKTIYSCPDCPEKFDNIGEFNEHLAYEQAKKDIKVVIKNNPGSKTIKFGETLRLTAITSAPLPEGTKICWYVDGVKSGEGETFEIKFESGSKTVTVKITDSNEKVLKNSSNKEIADSQNVSVNSGIWQKIVSFFKNLFGMNRTVIQKIFR